MRAGGAEPGRGALQTQGPATCRLETVSLFPVPTSGRETACVRPKKEEGARERALTSRGGHTCRGGVSIWIGAGGPHRPPACPSRQPRRQHVDSGGGLSGARIREHSGSLETTTALGITWAVGSASC